MNGEQHQYCSPHRVRRPFRRAELPARLASRSRTAGERFKGSKAWWAWASAESGSKQAARMRLKREQEVCWPNQAEGYSQRRPVVVKPLPLNLPYLAFADSEAFRDEFARLRYRQTVVLRSHKGCENFLSPLQRKYFVGHPVFLLGSLTQLSTLALPCAPVRLQCLCTWVSRTVSSLAQPFSCPMLPGDFRGATTR